MSVADALTADGFAALPRRLPHNVLVELGQLFDRDGPGTRIIDAPPAAVERLLGWEPLRGALREIDPSLRPVRILTFQKTAASNWFVPWHQDAKVGVHGDVAAHGFKNRTVKDGVEHFEAPVDLLERMVSARIHLDPSTIETGALEVALGTHRAGFIGHDDMASFCARARQIVCEAGAGEIHLLRPLLCHRSRRASVPNRRRTLHIELASGDALPRGVSWHMRASAAVTA